MDYEEAAYDIVFLSDSVYQYAPTVLLARKLLALYKVEDVQQETTMACVFLASVFSDVSIDVRELQIDRSELRKEMERIAYHFGGAIRLGTCYKHILQILHERGLKTKTFFDKVITVSVLSGSNLSITLRRPRDVALACIEIVESNKNPTSHLARYILNYCAQIGHIYEREEVTWNNEKYNVSWLTNIQEFDVEELGDEGEDEVVIPNLRRVRDERSVSKLGEGGFGSVYKVVATVGNERDVILAKKNQDKLSSFFRELGILRTFEHENIVRCDWFSIWTTNNRLVYSLYLEIADTSLLSEIYDKIRSSNISLSVEDVWKRIFINHSPITSNYIIELYKRRTYAFQVSKALEYLHSKNVIHRDIKADNVLIVGGVAKLADFGLSKSEVVDKNDEVRSTRSGTPRYHSPEFLCLDIRGVSYDYYSFEQDVWSLGITLLEMETGSNLEYPGRVDDSIFSNPQDIPLNFSDTSEANKKILRARRSYLAIVRVLGSPEEITYPLFPSTRYNPPTTLGLQDQEFERFVMKLLSYKNRPTMKWILEQTERLSNMASVPVSYTLSQRREANSVEMMSVEDLSDFSNLSRTNINNISSMDISRESSLILHTRTN